MNAGWQNDAVLHLHRKMLDNRHNDHYPLDLEVYVAGFSRSTVYLILIAIARILNG